MRVRSLSPASGKPFRTMGFVAIVLMGMRAFSRKGKIHRAMCIAFSAELTVNTNDVNSVTFVHWNDGADYKCTMAVYSLRSGPSQILITSDVVKKTLA